MAFGLKDLSSLAKMASNAMGASNNEQDLSSMPAMPDMPASLDSSDDMVSGAMQQLPMLLAQVDFKELSDKLSDIGKKYPVNVSPLVEYISRLEDFKNISDEEAAAVEFSNPKFQKLVGAVNDPKIDTCLKGGKFVNKFYSHPYLDAVLQALDILVKARPYILKMQKFAATKQ